MIGIYIPFVEIEYKLKIDDVYVALVKQMNGHVSMKIQNGTEFFITFPP